MRKRPNFILLHEAIQFAQHHWLNRHSFPTEVSWYLEKNQLTSTAGSAKFSQWCSLGSPPSEMGLAVPQGHVEDIFLKFYMFSSLKRL